MICVDHKSSILEAEPTSNYTIQMSKSRGNVVDPFDQISQFGLDPLRYFLLKEGSLHHDGGIV